MSPSSPADFQIKNVSGSDITLQTANIADGDTQAVDNTSVRTWAQDPKFNWYLMNGEIEIILFGESQGNGRDTIQFVRDVAAGNIVFQ